MNLFDAAREKALDQQAPLSVRMQPQTLAEFEGQEDVLGPGTLLRKLIENDKLQSLILYGPPGTGKTALARVIARYTKAHFATVNAVMAGIADLRAVVKEAEDRRGMHGRRTVVFIDEIHRFNKAQQDALLPYVESGLLVLIGATTENPMFEVRSALNSRARIIQFHPLSPDNISSVLRRALTDRERGLGGMHVVVEEAALTHLVKSASGDARRALNNLEMAVFGGEAVDGTITVDLELAQQATQHALTHYDRDGDNHYDVISAFIKSMRGSDPDATLYWLARMIHAGEDPKFIARRIMIHAAEDVGMADPNALVVAISAAQTVERIGLPEGRIVLAEAALYIATAPKSNAVVKGIDGALTAVTENPAAQVPAHLRDSHYKGAVDLGHGVGYRYPHDAPTHWVSQEYLPDSLHNLSLYEPGHQGYEKAVRDRLKDLRRSEKQDR